MTTARDVNETLKDGILPVLLDNTPEAHRLAGRLFRRFGVVSLICGRSRLRDLFDLSSQTLRLPQTDCDRLRVEELIAFVEKSEGMLPILVPCSDRARDTVTRYAAVLESRFILSDTDAIFSAPPLTALAQQLCDTPTQPLT